MNQLEVEERNFQLLILLRLHKSLSYPNISRSQTIATLQKSHVMEFYFYTVQAAGLSLEYPAVIRNKIPGRNTSASFTRN